ncbi:MAG: hypothetical protein R3E66_15400 [bacterium]
MNVGYLTIGLVILGMVACGVGAFGIAKYAFRISSGKGALAFLFPPYTFYFSFFELQEEGKETPIALWLSGLFVTLLISVAFWQPINMVFQGKADELYPPAADEMEKQFGQKPVSAELSKPIAELEVPVQAPAATNNATNGAGTNNTADTNNAAPATNGGTNNAPAAP